MQQKPYKKRDARWNYGGPNWKLSRSKIDLFLECPKCFYLDNKLGIKRPAFPSFNLNLAVDTLLKKEFDLYREKGEKHPLMEKYKIDAKPFEHPDLNEWRENFEGVSFVHKPTNMIISGAVDDLWLNSKKEVIVVDYKATSKEEKISLDDPWKDSYKRQIEVYQWLLRQKGFEVSEIGYFVYANALTSLEKFDQKLDFEITLLEYLGKPEWVEPIIFKIKETLEAEEVPSSGENCEYCGFCDLRFSK